MKLNIHSIHFTASERLIRYVQKKCEKFNRYYQNIVQGDVNLKLLEPKSGPKQMVEIKLQVPGQTLIASVEGNTFEEATDLCTAKISQQLKKFKGKISRV